MAAIKVCLYEGWHEERVEMIINKAQEILSAALTLAEFKLIRRSSSYIIRLTGDEKLCLAVLASLLTFIFEDEVNYSLKLKELDLKSFLTDPNAANDSTTYLIQIPWFKLFHNHSEVLTYPEFEAPIFPPPLKYSLTDYRPPDAITELEVMYSYIDLVHFKLLKSQNQMDLILADTVYCEYPTIFELYQSVHSAIQRLHQENKPGSEFESIFSAIFTYIVRRAARIQCVDEKLVIVEENEEWKNYLQKVADLCIETTTLPVLLIRFLAVLEIFGADRLIEELSMEPKHVQQACLDLIAIRDHLFAEVKFPDFYIKIKKLLNTQ